MLAAGETAPDFTLPDQEGRPHSLSDYKGRTVVLYFYPRDMTPGCTREACDFRDNLNRLEAAGAAVLGISADSVDRHRRFAAKEELTFPLLADVDHEVATMYGVWGEKKLYGRIFQGITRATYIIDATRKILRVFPKVKVAGHVDEVLRAITD